MKLFSKGKIGAAWNLLSNKSEHITPTEQDIQKYFIQTQQDQSGLFKSMLKKPTKFKVNKNHLLDLINHTANYKTPGLSRVTYEHLKQLSKIRAGIDLISQAIEQIINNTEKVNPQIFTASTTFLTKSSGGLRPICIQENLLKITNKMINDIILQKAIIPNMSKSQFCLTGQDAQLKAVDKLNSFIQGKEYRFFSAIDFTNAFGLLEHNAIIEALSKFNEIQRLVSYIARYLQMTAIKTEILDDKNQQTTMRTYNITKGVPQGDPLSMTLFVTTLDTIIKQTLKKFSSDIQIVAYADDVVLIGKTQEILENAKQFIQEEAGKIGLIINENKTQEYTTYEENINGYANLNNTTWKYLGIHLSTQQTLIDKSVNLVLGELVDQTRNLFNQHITLQAKYHIYKTCILSKVVYMFRGTNISQEILQKHANEITNILIKYFGHIPKNVRKLPISLGGIGLYNIWDLYRICRLTYLIQSGKCHIPKELVRHVKKASKNIQSSKDDNLAETDNDLLNLHGQTQKIISQAVFYQAREQLIKRVKKHETYYVTVPKQILLDLLDDKQNRAMNRLISTAPTSPSHLLTDDEFNLCLDLRYGIVRPQYRTLQCIYHSTNEDSKYNYAPGTANRFWHSLNCIQSNVSHKTHLHNSIVGCIGNLLVKNKNIKDIKYEAFSNNSDQTEDGRHRPDIIAITDNGEYIIDVTIISRFTTNLKLNRYQPDTGYKIKKAQYQNDPRLKPIVFDTAGRIHPESLQFLKTMGATSQFIRMIQTKIIRQQAVILNRTISSAKELEHRNNIKNFTSVAQQSPNKTATPQPVEVTPITDTQSK